MLNLSLLLRQDGWIKRRSSLSVCKGLGFSQKEKKKVAWGRVYSVRSDYGGHSHLKKVVQTREGVWRKARDLVVTQAPASSGISMR